MKKKMKKRLRLDFLAAAIVFSAFQPSSAAAELLNNNEYNIVNTENNSTDIISTTEALTVTANGENCDVVDTGLREYRAPAFGKTQAPIYRTSVPENTDFVINWSFDKDGGDSVCRYVFAIDAGGAVEKKFYPFTMDVDNMETFMIDADTVLNAFGENTGLNLDNDVVFLEVYDSTTVTPNLLYGLLVELVPEQKETWVNPFKDVYKDEYYYEAVLWAAQKGITTGVKPTLFKPNDGCTRGQIVTFIWRAEGEPAATSTGCTFEDVDNTQFYYDPMLWAVETGVITGYSDEKFGPDDVCTRGQIVTMLWRAMNKPEITNKEHPFTDIKAGEYYYEPVLWAVQNKITTGQTAADFVPDKNVTRGETVTFLYRVYAEE